MFNKTLSLLATILFFVICADAFAQRLSVSTPIGNVRSGPGTKFDILWKTEKYYPIFVLKRSGSWRYFRDFEGDKGWIHKSIVDKTPSVIVKKEKCNVRAGAGTKFKVLFTVEKGIPFKIIKRKGNWINVCHADGDAGWIHNSLVW